MPQILNLLGRLAQTQIGLILSVEFTSMNRKTSIEQPIDCNALPLAPKAGGPAEGEAEGAEAGPWGAFSAGFRDLDCQNLPSSPSLWEQDQATELFGKLSLAHSVSSLSNHPLPNRNSRRKLTAETSPSETSLARGFLVQGSTLETA
jgi:hypothetical protein